MDGVQVDRINHFSGYSKKSPSKLPDGLHQQVNNISTFSGNLVKSSGFIPAELNGVLANNTGLGKIDEFVRFSYNGTYLCHDSTTGELMLWNGSTWVSVGDLNAPTSCRFVDRGNELLIACGDVSPKVYGHVAEHFKYAYLCDGTADVGVLLEALAFYPGYLNHFLIPVNVAMFNRTAWPTGISDVLARMYCVVLQSNDGSYWLSNSTITQITDSSNPSKVAMDLIVNSVTYPSVSRVLLFASKFPYSEFYLIRNIDVNMFKSGSQSYIVAGLGTYNNTTGEISLSSTFPADDIVEDQYNGFVVRIYDTGVPAYYHVISDTGNLDNVITIPAGLGYSGTLTVDIVEVWRKDGDYYVVRVMDDADVLTSFPEMLNYVGYSYSYYAENLEPSTHNVGELFTNYTYAVIGAARMYVAGITRNGETYLQRVYFSYIDNNGVSKYDLFLDLNYIDVSGYNVGNIQGLDFNQQKLYVFCERGILILSIATGDVMSWKLDRLVHEIGVIAPKSITRIPDGKFAGGYGYVSADGFRVLYGGYSYFISESIIPIVATTLSEAVGYYDTDDRSWCVSFPTDNLVYCYNLDTNQWTLRTYIEVENVGKGDLDQTLVTDGDGIWEFGVSSFYNEFGVNPYWRSKMISWSDYGRVRRVALRYKSDTAFFLDVYRDGLLDSSIAVPASTEWTTVKFRLSISEWINTLEFALRMEDVAADLNTIFEVEYLEYEYQLRRAYA